VKDPVQSFQGHPVLFRKSIPSIINRCWKRYLQILHKKVNISIWLTFFKEKWTFWFFKCFENVNIQPKLKEMS